MPAIASISLTDGQPTPVVRVFTPTKVDSEGVAHYDNRAGGIAVGYDQLSIGLRAPGKGSQNYKATLRLRLPTLEVTSPSTASGIQPQPTRAYDCFANIEMVLPQRSSAQNREDLVKMIYNALAAGGVFATVVENLETVY